jgi:hypothetical protein
MRRHYRVGENDSRSDNEGVEESHESAHVKSAAEKQQRRGTSWESALPIADPGFMLKVSHALIQRSDLPTVVSTEKR